MTDRPPTILSSNGEGYCRHCHFIEGLDRNGLLDVHYRGKIMAPSWNGSTAKPCKGSSRKPAAVTPVTSRKAAFRVTAPTGACGVCGKPGVALNYSMELRGMILESHPNGVKICPGSFRAAADRA